MRVLGIETSCDETAAAVVGRDGFGSPEILSNVVLGQMADHAAFGGVVPEIAARAHLGALDGVISAALAKAGCELADIDAIAATGGPGLIGGLMVGLMTAKAISAAAAKPMLAINHLEGHALTARLTDNLEFPFLLLLVSGGHTQIVCVRGLGQYERWGTTLDDALGEAFDKTAKLLNLPFPGGPNVEKAAMRGDCRRFSFPVPMQGDASHNFSFSGLKTAVRQQAEKLEPLGESDITDICAAFQLSVSLVLADRLKSAMSRFENELPNGGNRNLVVAGGVAANELIRSGLMALCGERGWNFVAPPLHLCGDNAAMIAWAGLEHFEAGDRSGLDFSPRPRWPLDEASPALVGSGRRGAKA
jgi:N6-L-threonylcarbamoyladenine synthase